MCIHIKETLIYWLCGRIAASRGTRKLAYLHDMWLHHNLKVSLRRNMPLCGMLSRFLRAGLLVLHPARQINQRLLIKPAKQASILSLLVFVVMFMHAAEAWAQTSSEAAAQELLRLQERERVLREQQERIPDVRLPKPETPQGLERLPSNEADCVEIKILPWSVTARINSSGP